MRITLEHVSFSYEDDDSKKGVQSTQGTPRTFKKNYQGHQAPHDKTQLQGEPEHAAQILKDVCLSIEPGNVLGIAGKTGSGKSTLLQIAAGILSPTTGHVYVDGNDLADRSIRTRLRGQIGVVFQYPERQLFASTVIDDVAFGPKRLGYDARDVQDRVYDALNRVGLDAATIGHANPFSLSGGTQRRVAIAGVLAMHPQVLILDEPADGLDAAGHQDMVRIIQNLAQDDTAIALVSHDMDDLAMLSDTVAVLDERTITLIGAPEEIFTHENTLTRAGLTTPHGVKLARKLSELRVDASPAPSIEELTHAIYARYQERSANT